MTNRVLHLQEIEAERKRQGATAEQLLARIVKKTEFLEAELNSGEVASAARS